MLIFVFAARCCAESVCFFSQDKTKCHTETAYGPGEYSQFKVLVGDSPDALSVNVVEPIALDAPLFIGNMVRCRNVTFHGNNEITGTLFVAPGYTVRDDDFTLRLATIIVEGGAGGLPAGKAVLEQGAKEVVVVSSAFPRGYGDYPFTEEVYEGPKVSTRVVPETHELAFGQLALTASYASLRVLYKGEVTESIANVCVGSGDGCVSADEVVASETMVNLTVKQSNGVLKFEKRNYNVTGEGNPTLVLDCATINDAVSLEARDLVLDFQCAEQNVVVNGPEVRLVNVEIAQEWSGKLEIANLTATPEILNALKIGAADKIRVLTNASQVTFGSAQTTFDDEVVSKSLGAATIIAEGPELALADQLGATVTIVPEFEEEPATVSVTEVTQKSQVLVDGFANVTVNLAGIESPAPVNISNPGMLKLELASKTTINSLFVNRSQGTTLETDHPMHIVDIEFGGKEQVIADELIVSNGTVSADKLRIGKQNSDLVTNLQVVKKLELLEQSTLTCDGCTISETSDLTIITGGKVPLPQLILTSDSTFNPKTITVLIEEGVTPRDYQKNHSIANKTPYTFISGFVETDQCDKILPKMQNLPYGYVARCENNVLKIYAGDVWNTPVHYTTKQTIGLIFATIIVLGVQFFITWFL